MNSHWEYVQFVSISRCLLINKLNYLSNYIGDLHLSRQYCIFTIVAKYSSFKNEKSRKNNDNDNCFIMKIRIKMLDSKRQLLPSHCILL